MLGILPDRLESRAVFEAVAILIIVFGVVAIGATAVGAMSPRSMNVGLVLSGFILGLQALMLIIGVITNPPPSKDAPSEEEASPETDGDGTAYTIVVTGLS